MSYNNLMHHQYDKDKKTPYPYICNKYGDVIYIEDGFEVQGAKQDYEEYLSKLIK